MSFLSKLLFRTCCVCGNIAPKGICSDCEKLLAQEIYTTKFQCATYGGAVDIYSLSFYFGMMEEVIRAYKFDCKKYLSFIYVDMLENFIREKHIDTTKALFAFLPSSKKGFKQRGFNQVEKVIERCNVNYIDIIQLNKHHKQRVQKSLNRTERFANSQGKFAINTQNFDTSILSQYDTLYIVDDIYTTGASMKSVIKLLKETFSKNNINISLTGVVFAKASAMLGL